MKRLNKLLIISFSSFVIISMILYLSVTNEVGDISINTDSDNPNFRIKGHVYQYYQSGAKYEGERAAIRNYLLPKNIFFKSLKNGWVTARFIVNHQGYTDRFRFFCINTDYNEVFLSHNEEDYLLKTLRSLKKWKIGKVDNEEVDSYYQITLKIENGKIINIF